MTQRITAIMLIALAGGIIGLAGYGFMELAAPGVQASSAPPCTPIGATGNIVISRCEDEKTGQTIYVNNVGFMVVEP